MVDWVAKVQERDSRSMGSRAAHYHEQATVGMMHSNTYNDNSNTSDIQYTPRPCNFASMKHIIPVARRV